MIRCRILRPRGSRTLGGKCWSSRPVARVAAGDLLAGMNRAAHGLLDLGVDPGDTMAVVLSNRREFIECYGAAIQSGLFFVAINWHLGPARSATSWRIRAPGSWLPRADSPTWSRGPEAGGDRPVDDLYRRRLRGDGLRSRSSSKANRTTTADRAPGQIMFYTSGTTGRPKGVRKSFRAEPSDELTLTRGSVRSAGSLRPDNRSEPSASDLVYLNSGPFYHALPIAGVVSALDNGGLAVVMDKWTPESFLDLVEEYRVTNATLVPTMFHRLLALPEEVRMRADVSSLRAVNHAGAPCPIEVKRRMIEWWGPIITEAYSSTEGAGTSVTSEEWLRKPGTVGRPSPGVRSRSSTRTGKECPPGEQGLVYMTPSLWDFEYHHDDDKTRAARQRQHVHRRRHRLSR